MTVLGPICGDCPHREDGVIWIPFTGSGSNRVLLVGDSGWQNEASTVREVNGNRVGTPFSGPSGYFIERQLRRIGVKRQDFIIANAVWCRAKHLGWADQAHKFPDAALALEHCRPYLDELIARMKPAAIVPMGNVALSRVCGVAGIRQNQFYILNTSYGAPAIPLMHPSAILQGNQKMSGVWAYGIKRALNIAEGLEIRPLQDELLDLLLDPSPAELEAHIEKNFKGWGVCDIETLGGEEVEEEDSDEDEDEDDPAYLPETWTITRIGFSLGQKSAFSVPWTEPYISICRRLWERMDEVWLWNQAFDVLRLRRQGWPAPKRIIDGMWLWHWLQSDLPKALEFVAPLILPLRPWKHLSSQNPALYNGLDNLIEYMVIERLMEQCEDEGRWAGFERHCINMIPLLEGMSAKGVLIDKEAQQSLKQELLAERTKIGHGINLALPAGVRKVKTWTREPKPSQSFNAEELAGVKHEIIGTKQKKSGEVVPVVQWSLELPFNPGSSEQVKDFIRALDLKVPVEKGKETTKAKKLRVLERKNVTFKSIRHYREHSKLITSYMWPTASDGRVHPQFGFHPSTWRKSARDPNIQTIPKRNNLAKKFRRLVVASPGCLLGEADSNAIEAVLVGYYAQSPRYIELARKGVHKWLAEQFAGRPVSKEEPLYDKIKRVVHMSNYMGTPERILDEYPDDFSSLKEARELQEFYFSTAAGKDVRRWQQATMERAHKEHYLQTPFGQRHYFYDVFSYSDGEWKMGSDAKRAVAFLPQASASALQDIFLQQFCQKYPNWLDRFIALVHDSFIADIAEPITHDFMRALHGVMTNPIHELGGLWIGAEPKIGPNLADMEKI